MQHEMYCGGGKRHLGDHPTLTYCGRRGWRSGGTWATLPTCSQCKRALARKNPPAGGETNG